MSPRTLQSRVLALTGAGILIATAAVSLLSRQSLLALEARVRAEQRNTAQITAGVIARDVMADLDVLNEAIWRSEFAAAARSMRLGDGICRADQAGRAIVCAPEALAWRMANPLLAASVREATATQRPVVSPFVAQADGTFDAVATVPMPAADRRAGAMVAVIARNGSWLRNLLTTGDDMALTLDVVREKDSGTIRIAGTPWSIVATETTEAAETIQAFRRRSLWFAPSIAAVALLLAWGLVLSIQRPVNALTAAAERIAAGNLIEPVPGGGDEIGRLGTALDNMRVRLKTSIEEVNRANAVLERRVEERTSQLQRLLGKVISAQEDERRRVARELHDETSQVLAALGMALHHADAMSPERMRELEAFIDRMHEGLHRVIVNLRPPAIDDLGLAAAIDAFAAAQLRRAGINVRCELGTLQDRRVDPAIEIALFRVVQEAVLNIVRHSGATSVAIEGGLTAGRLWIEIEDDGRGFDPASIAPDDSTLRGIGLVGMRERMELLGGRFEVESAPGEGTRVHVDVRVTS